MIARAKAGDQVAITAGMFKGAAGVVEATFSKTVAVRRRTDRPAGLWDVIVVGYADVERVEEVAA